MVSLNLDGVLTLMLFRKPFVKPVGRFASASNFGSSKLNSRSVHIQIQCACLFTRRVYKPRQWKCDHYEISVAGIIERVLSKSRGHQFFVGQLRVA